MNSGGRGFGFQVCGGSDTSMLAQVDMVLPGSSAEQGGLRSGDRITTVNGQNVMSLKHTEIVSTIRKVSINSGLYLECLKDPFGGKAKWFMGEAFPFLPQ